MSSTLAGKKGNVLLLVVVIMGIMLTMSSSIIGYSSVHLAAQRQTNAFEQARAAAEAGIDNAIYQLNQNVNFNGETNVQFGSSTYSTVVTALDSVRKRVTATGNAQIGHTPTSTRVITIVTGIDQTGASFASAIQVGAGGLVLNNSSQINGNVFSNGNISGAGTINGSAIVAGDIPSNPDQNWDAYNTDFLFGNTSSRTAVAQSFIPTITAPVSLIKLYLKKTGNPGNLTFQIVTDNNGTPSNQVTQTATINSSDITDNYSWVKGIFTNPPTLNSGTRYWLMLVKSNNSNNYYRWAADNTNNFPNNTGLYSASWNNSTPVWNTTGSDFNFAVYLGGTITSLSGVTVNGDATAPELTDCTIGGNALWQISNTCNVAGSSAAITTSSAPAAFPISADQISQWETEAEAGTIYSGNYLLDNDHTATLGPTKISGDLILSGNSVLTANGPLWVVGNISASNQSKILLDQSVGDAGVAIIADMPSASTTKGQITISNSAIIAGNGQPHSFPLLISGYKGTANAITLSNTSSGTIYFAPFGKIDVSNSATVIALTGYQISLKNSATIDYKIGLQDAKFTSGPGGSWKFIPGSYVIVR